MPSPKEALCAEPNKRPPVPNPGKTIFTELGRTPSVPSQRGGPLFQV